MAQLTPVKVCLYCGEVGVSLDTYCLRCQRRGTLQSRFRCESCDGLCETESCPTCELRTAVRATPSSGSGIAPLPDRLIPDLSTNEPPPWLAGLVGGILIGAAVGATAHWFMGYELWIMLAIGVGLGGGVGAFANSKSA